MACLTCPMSWHLRAIGAPDAAVVARLHRRTMRAAMPYLPVLHTPADDLAFFTSEVDSSDGWVAVHDSGVRGFALTRDGLLNQLFVDVGWQGLGMGTALLGEVVAHVGPGLRLWAFQRNEHARGFYRHHGFVEVERTDGAGNEEKEPDVLLQWG